MQSPAESRSKLARRHTSNLHLLETLEPRTLLTADPVAHLVFLSDPSATGTKTLTHFKVEVEDANGTKLTKDHTPVTLSITIGSSNGTLSGKLSVKPQNGIASFNDVILQTPGTFTLTATDGNITKSSDNFQVLQIVPTKLKVISVYPANNFHPVSGQLGPVTVDVLDANGHIATDFTSGSPLSNGTSNGSNGSFNAPASPTITLTLTSTLSTETTLGTPTNVLTITQDATAGVAVFATSAITAQTPGWYQLTVSAGNLTQQSFLVFIR